MVPGSGTTALKSLASESCASATPMLENATARLRIVSLMARMSNLLGDVDRKQQQEARQSSNVKKLEYLTSRAKDRPRIWKLYRQCRGGHRWTRSIAGRRASLGAGR